MRIHIVAIAALLLANSGLYAQNFDLNYNFFTGALDLIKVGTLDATTVEMKSESGLFTGSKPSHFNGRFDVYNANRAFKLDPDGFGTIRGFAFLHPRLTEHDLTVDGSLVGGGPLGQIGIRPLLDFCHFSEADVCLDFGSPLPDGFELFGDAERGHFLTVNDAANVQRGTVVFPPLGGNGQLVIGGRTSDANSAHHIDNIEMDFTDNSLSIAAHVRIGGGTDRPGDGFSMSFVRPDDPVLDDGEGWAASPGGEENLPEEGTVTGLSIGFDERDSGAGDVVGMSIRVDGEILAQVPMPTLNGAVEDITSIQTGQNDDGVEGLAWARLAIRIDDLPSNGTYFGSRIEVRYKESEIFAGHVLSPVLGDFDGNGNLDIRDLDLLSQRIHGNQGWNPLFDLDDDGSINETDRRIWIDQVFGTYFGDANLDGEFNSSDLVTVFSADEYEDNVAMNSSWAEGDWNGDREFDSGDLVLAFTAGGYEQGPRQSNSVSEPTTPFFVIFGLVGVAIRSRLRYRALHIYEKCH